MLPGLCLPLNDPFDQLSIGLICLNSKLDLPVMSWCWLALPLARDKQAATQECLLMKGEM